MSTPSRQSQYRDHIRSYYGIAVKRGMRVVVDGEPGKITGFRGQYLLVRLDCDKYLTYPKVAHPTWRVAYPELGIEARD